MVVMKDELKIKMMQFPLEWERHDRNLKFFEGKMEAIQEETDLIVLPEMFTTGFTMNAAEMAEPSEGKTLKWMQKQSKKYNSAIVGSIIVEEDRKFYNRLYFVLPDGNFHFYNKRHTFTLAGEHKVYESGKEKLIVTYKGWKICPLVCYDLRFPVWSRNVEDYDLLIYIANWPERRITAWDTLLKARAIENMSYCVGVNRVGEDGNDITYSGGSMAFDGLGREMIDYIDGEGILSVTLDKLHLENIRNSLCFLKDRDKFILK